MKESARYILQILVFLALILSVGTGGYLLLENGITFEDAFYMAVTAITPAKFEEVHKLSVAGRYFTIALVFCGFGAVVAFATQFARLVIQSELEGVGVFTRKQMQRRIRRMKNHYIVCGYGDIGGAICGELQDQQLPFVVVTNDEPSIEAVRSKGYALVKGNPTADGALKEAEIEKAEGVIAILSDDSDNLFIALAARELNPQTYIIARGEKSSTEDRILRAGADIVVSPMKLGGQQIAGLIKEQSNAAGVISDCSAASAVAGLRLQSHRQPHGQTTTVADLLGSQRWVGIAGIQRSDGTFAPSPSADAVIAPEDVAVMIARDRSQTPLGHAPPSNKLILLADDHRALRLLFTRKLGTAGHEVVQAGTGEEALAKTRAHSPDLIVLDVNMPQPDGYTVCETLRRDEQFRDVPVILYSGDETDEFLRRGKAAGATLCLRKTSKSSELLANIETLFAAGESDQLSSASASNSPKLFSETTDRADMHLMDMSVALGNVNGDRELLGEIIDVWLEDTPQIMQRLDAAVNNLDYTSLRRQAHSLKSSASILGASPAADAASKLEAVEVGADRQFVDKLHVELRQRIDELTKQLLALVASQKIES